MRRVPAFSHAPADLAADFERLLAVMAGFEGRWWVIGSAAMVLYGVEGVDPKDIDVLVSAEGALQLSKLWGIAPLAMRPDPRFRSRVFLRKTLWRREAEVMGGFEVSTGQDWKLVEPAERIAVQTICGSLHVPSIGDLIDMCRRFGRPKDIERLVRLETVAP